MRHFKAWFKYLLKEFYKTAVKPPHEKEDAAIPIPVTAMPEGRIKKILYKTLKGFYRLFFAFLYEVEVEGQENIPVDGSAILASNHASFLDPMLMFHSIPRRYHALAGAWLFKIKLISWALKAVDSIPAKGSVNVSVAALDRKEAILIFPDGRCTCGKKGVAVKPRKGAAVLALKTGAPVIPIGITGTFEAWPQTRYLPNLFKKLTVRIGKPLVFEKCAEGEIPADLLQRTLDKIMYEINALIISEADELAPSAIGIRGPRPEVEEAITAQRPRFVITPAYSGVDRRRSIRIKAHIEIQLITEDERGKAYTKDVSRHGILFESKSVFPLNSEVKIEINLPAGHSDRPIEAVVRIVRAAPVSDNKFYIGAEFMKIPMEGLNRIIKYAASIAEK